MLLIATDEAGYGPKLGPLVIVATAWRLSGEQFDRSDCDRRFAALAQPVACGTTRVIIDDSKTVFDRAAGLSSLHAAVSASLNWCGKAESNLVGTIARIAKEDCRAIAASPWLRIDDTIALLTRDATQEVQQQWKQTELQLVDVTARVISAAAFNEHCDRGYNKADLLSASTLGLVQSAIARHARDDRNVVVFCDRHGGRRYYGGVLQHVFPDARLQIVDEGKHQSVYALADDHWRCRVHFTVKGDSFTPVALSSMHAKYLRERFMEAFNQFFRDRHQGSEPLRETAGYPVDADRFLADIAPILKSEAIESTKLVRSR